MFWPENLEEYCNCLMEEYITSDTKVTNSIKAVEVINSTIKSYIGCSTQFDTIIIKTSATGRRKKNHEISDFILDTVCCAVRNIAKHSKVILAEGMAYSPSFEKECKRLGWDKIAEKYNIEMVDLNYDSYTIIDNHWPVANTWMMANKIINVCKAKTHKRCGVTLSTKNLLGLLPGKEMGFPKLSHKHEYIPKLIYSIAKESPKMLCIIDGINGIQGNGPMKGRSCKSDFIVIGTNPFNCDAIATIQMGFHPAVVSGCIRPFQKKALNKHDINIRDLKIDSIDFIPSLSCYWLYKSLYKDTLFLNSSYITIMEEIRRCWKLRI